MSDRTLAPIGADADDGAHAETTREDSWGSIAGPADRLCGLSAIDVLLGAVVALSLVAPTMAVRFHIWAPLFSLLLLVGPVGVLALARQSRADRIAMAATAVILWAVLSAVLSDAPWVSLVGAVGRYESVLVLVGFFACWALGRLASPSGRVLAVGAFLGGVALNIMLAVIELARGHEFGVYAAIQGRAPGLMANSVYFGAMTAGAFALLVRIWHDRSTRHVSLMCASIGAAFGSALSGSRIAFAVVGAVAVAEVVRSRRWLPAVSALAGTSLGAVTVAAASSNQASTVIGAGRGFGSRGPIYGAAARAVLDRPIQGAGLGRVRPAIQGHVPDSVVAAGSFDARLNLWFDVHNAVLQYLVALGVVGALLVAVWATLAVRRSPGPATWAAVGIAATWIAQPVHLATMIPVAALLGVGARDRFAWRPSTSAIRASVPLALTVVGALAALAVHVVDRRVASAWDRTDVSAMVELSDWAPWDPNIAGLAAGVAERAGDLDVRLRMTRRAAAAEPDLAFRWTDLGQAQLDAGDRAAAIRSFERALDLQLSDPEAISGLCRASSPVDTSPDVAVNASCGR